MDFMKTYGLYKHCPRGLAHPKPFPFSGCDATVYSDGWKNLITGKNAKMPFSSGLAVVL